MIYNKDGDSISLVYNAEGIICELAYDIDGNIIHSFDEDITIHQDSSTGTASGYTLTSEETHYEYVLRSMINSRLQSIDMQSCIYDSDNHNYYVFAGGWYVGKYDSSYQYVETITLPQFAGHNNDGFYYNGKIYLTNSKSSLYVWDVAQNTISTLSISGISNPQNGSVRSADALCRSGVNGTAFISCRDIYNSSDIDHQEGDKLSIYSLNLSTGVCTLVAEFPWDCVYLQGMVYHDGIIYCACNTQTTGAASNYTGITVKAIRTDTWELIDELTYSGNVEPEGMDVVPADETMQLEIGIAHYGGTSLVTRFTAPYTLND